LEEERIQDSNVNPRAKITQKKYKKQIEWRRNKVKELLIRGYSQYEISNILHISQPTISRDINNIYEHKEKRQKKYGKDLVLEVQNTLAGLAELIKKSWTTVDDPKTESKEKMKAISFIMQCYNNRLDLLKFEPQAIDLKQYIDTIKQAEKDIVIKEQALQSFVKEHKLTPEEVDYALDPSANTY
jgi:predicted transcriptional regulator